MRPEPSKRDVELVMAGCGLFSAQQNPTSRFHPGVSGETGPVLPYAEFEVCGDVAPGQEPPTHQRLRETLRTIEPIA